jgi:hypothetical protein
MTKTADITQCARNGAARRCAICHGKFGLIRYYSWRTALCSKKCRARFKTREEGNRNWLRRFQAATNGSWYYQLKPRCY